MNLVMTGDGRYAEIQATAEHEAFTLEQHAELLRLGRVGAGQIMAAQHRILNLDLPRLA
jgi:ribonuclease PH